jgi:aspartyl-tRNA(Asn)/glutamyl-tRNA(Gln) amidotransferase subunit B
MSFPSEKYEMVIGIEVHVQLLTNTKLFCGCASSFNHEPNSLTCPVCLGLPGSLPSVNEKAIRMGLKVAIALNCRIPEKLYFSRKSYFYPDLPKGYQISQSDSALGFDGFLEIYHDNQVQKVYIQRVHLEEDSAKLIHRPDGFSYVDYNRAGIPLVEIVTVPDIHSAAEAKEYLVELRELLRELSITDGSMEEGSFRCEPNVSIRLKGSSEMHAKTELKNINSFSSVVRGIDNEFERQVNLVENAGWGALINETRGYDARDNMTFMLRSKECPDEYRFFPEPDLPVHQVSESTLNDIEKEIPELPLKRKINLMNDFKIGYNHASLLIENGVQDYFKRTVELGGNPDDVVNWLTTDTFRYLRELKVDLNEDRIKPEFLVILLDEINSRKISRSSAKEVWKEMLLTGNHPSLIIEEKGLEIADTMDEAEAVIAEIFEQEREIINRLAAGEEKLLGVIVGIAMKKLESKADPRKLTDLILLNLKSYK